MPTYRYKAKKIDGSMLKGVVDISDEHALYKQFREQDMFLVECKEVEATENQMAIKSQDLADFSRQLGTMINSGLSLTRALYIISTRCEKPKLQVIYENIYQYISQGQLLSDAMEAQGRAFPVLMINMIRAGENSGKLEEIAMKMANHYEKDNKLQAKVKNAMTYPILVGILTVAVVIIIFTFIFPKFFDLFKDMDLPATTKILMAFSKFLTNNWIAAILIAAVIVCLVILIFRLPPVIRTMDRIKLKMPVISKIMITIYTARFARGLSSLYSSGLSMVQSLQISKGLMGNSVLEEQFSDVIANVKNGVPLSRCMVDVNGLDPKIADNIYVGEESGKIDDILDNMADTYDYEADQATQRLVTLVEPVMIIFMALIIGTIMISVMMPIFQYYQSMQ